MHVLSIDIISLPSFNWDLYKYVSFCNILTFNASCTSLSSFFLSGSSHSRSSLASYPRPFSSCAQTMSSITFYFSVSYLYTPIITFRNSLTLCIAIKRSFNWFFLQLLVKGGLLKADDHIKNWIILANVLKVFFNTTAKSNFNTWD